MAYSSSSKLSVKITEKCHIYPPLEDSYSLPLTYLDIPWLLFPPSTPLFFFQLPPTSSPSFFATLVLPKLKLSLSSSLHYFSLFLAKLVAPPPSPPPLPPLDHPNQLSFVLDKTDSPSVPLTIAAVCDERDGQFEYLCKDVCQKNANDFHKLVPHLPQLKNPIGLEGLGPLLAIQITYFPKGPGFSIGFSYHRVASDERTFNNFIHCWASLCKNEEFPYGLWPNFDRAVVIDSNGLRPTFLNQFWDSKLGLGLSLGLGLVRSTFLMGPIEIGNAKKWILAQCETKNRPYPLLLSPYVVTCAFIWACLVRAQLEDPDQNRIRKGPMYFGFIAGGMTRLSYRVPRNYVGNCVGFGRAVGLREELLSEDGILVAADAIGETIKKLDRDFLGGSGNWISDWEAIIGSDLHVNIVGSPKVDLYEVDFGWGRPKKREEISIDVMRGISLTESREMKGGMEIGVTLPKSSMDAFSSFFNQGLVNFSL